MRQTPLFEQHQALGGKIVDFAGWALPVQYSSQKQEHNIVREHVGIFDVSHMSPVDLTGPTVGDFLRRLLTNDVAKLSDGRALYTCMCQADGGVIDDLIVYRASADHFRLVLNAGTRDSDMAWIESQLAGVAGVELTTAFDGVLIAVQGPEAIALCEKIGLPTPEKRFSFLRDGDRWIARTGYTGEDGVEIMLGAEDGRQVWQQLIDAGAAPCGLGARDSLRLEAGMALYGNDLDREHTPIASGLAWVVDLKDPAREFIGRDVIEAAKADPQEHMVGVVLEAPGVLRGHLPLFHQNQQVGELTSGGYSVSTGRSIGLARVSTLADDYEVEIRTKRLPLRRVKYPFVSHSKATF
ncbi:MAG: glycine cleavage system aminomethyltransferase GcvT [Gammaproteobacteria bacterium]|nr:glycine cleavage system aminomethyltransferase GcvT [Gammaproteobacteria bacterium]